MIHLKMGRLGLFPHRRHFKDLRAMNRKMGSIEGRVKSGQHDLRQHTAAGAA